MRLRAAPDSVRSGPCSSKSSVAQLHARPPGGEWSLGLIGDVSGQKPERKVKNRIRDIFDKQSRRKPLAFAVGAGDAAGYGI
jgi:hypothetical protein